MTYKQELNFVYDGINSEYFNIKNINVRQSLFEEHFLPETNVIKESIRGRHKDYFIDVERNPIVLDIDFLLEEPSEIEQLSNLPIDSKLIDMNVFEYKDGTTGNIILIEPVVWTVIAQEHTGYPENSTTLISEKLVNRQVFNSSGSQSWETSPVRHWLRNTFRSHLSLNFQKAILETTTNTGVGHVGGQSEAATLTDETIFILSYTEAGIGTLDNDGIHISYFNNAASRVSEGYEDGVLSGRIYWLRTPREDYSNHVFSVLASGNGGHNTVTSLNWLRPVVNLDGETNMYKPEGSDYYYLSSFLGCLKKWLMQDRYRPLHFKSNPNKIYYCIFSSNASHIHNGLKQGYVSMQMLCNDICAYSPIIEKDFVVSGNKKIGITNNGDLNIYPELWIEKTSASGDVKIKNTTDNERVLELSDIDNNETVYIHNEEEIIETDKLNTYRYNNHNNIFLKLLSGYNEIELEGNFNLHMKYQEKLL